MMTDGTDGNGHYLVRFTQMERAVLASCGVLLVAFLGFLGSIAWDTRESVRTLVTRDEYQVRTLDDHESRIRAVESRR